MRHVLLVAALVAAVGIVPVHAGPPVTAQFTPPSDSETCIAVETRVVQLPAAAFDQWCGQGRLGDGDTKFLTDAQLRSFLEVVQGDGMGCVLAAPKVTVLDGQTATVNIGQRQKVVRKVSVVDWNFQTMALPEFEDVDLGTRLTLKADTAADGKFVRLTTNYQHCELGANPAKLTLTSWVTPIFEGGSQGVPVPVTQFLEIPKVERQCIEKTVVVPDGKHVLVVGPKRTSTHKIMEKVPVLGELPLLGELFTDVRCEQVSERTVLILTPRVMCDAEPAAVAPPTTPVELPRLSRLDVHAELPRLSRLSHAAAAVAPVSAPVAPAAAWEPMPTPRPLPVMPPATAVPQPMPAPPPLPPMTPPQPMPMTWGDAGWSARCIEYMMCNLAEQQPQVMVQAMVMQVRSGFLAEAGLTARAGAVQPIWLIDPEGMDTLNAAIRNAKEGQGVYILSRPTVQVLNGQTGHVELARSEQVVTGVFIGVENGRLVYRPNCENLPAGVSLRITPRFSDRDRFLMRVEAQMKEVTQQNAFPVTVPKEATGAEYPLTTMIATPVVNCQAVQTAVELREGQTLVMGGLKCQSECGPLTAWAMRMCGCEPGCEYVIVLTPHVVKPTTPQALPLPAGPLQFNR